ncbi:Clp amino terminal domain-containing protein, pathogenicity island component [Parafrankia irregularis]|uniref:Clp amino terminal domain-containing protein, pathogenicity island component n=1 Tax=Parafrankia irregularis TaxID=795642 RepID=A0A0S4QJL6_9ACTN|nr:MULTISPECIES: Clp protease N-terminal domain-containing protein [Parafrankia]MBE3205667.1 hypothetical protein [Parafrankia sp. CH37]CUU55433.1 Clp amino terminal domain-containing protein, pathogenicity island component [Parafrankia irregularis]
MPARFTQCARRVIEISQEEALQLGHGAIRTEHLLLALLHEDSGRAGTLLRSVGLTVDNARRLARELGSTDEGTPGPHLPFTPRTKNVLGRSLQEMTARRHERIDAEHLLLALFGEDVRGGHQLLTQLGVDPSQIRSQVEEALSQTPA